MIIFDHTNSSFLFIKYDMTTKKMCLLLHIIDMSLKIQNVNIFLKIFFRDFFLKKLKKNQISMKKIMIFLVDFSIFLTQICIEITLQKYIIYQEADKSGRCSSYWQITSRGREILFFSTSAGNFEKTF